MKKLYLILNKQGRFEAHGNSSKSAWRSLYWVHYHIGRYSNLTDYRIMTLYSDGRTEIVSAIDAFSTLPKFKETINREIERDLGVKCDLDSLTSLYKGGFIASHLTAAITNLLVKYKKI
jgi:hypothetical protein